VIVYSYFPPILHVIIEITERSGAPSLPNKTEAKTVYGLEDL